MVKSGFILTIIFFLACSPERDNPYDPKSDFYTNKTQVLGTCQNRTLVPISNAQISITTFDNRWQLVTSTNDSGRYEFLDVPAETSVVISAIKDGFASVTRKIVLFTYKSETLNFILEGLPKFSNIQITSYYCVLNIPPFDSSMLSIKCAIDDDEGQSDITSVFATIDSLPDSLPLLLSSGNSYENFFREESLSDNLDNIIGRDISITVRDRFDNEVKSSSNKLVRIIRNPPEIISPAGLDIVSPLPVLVWTTQQYLFSHTFFFEIYRVPYPLPPVLYRRYEIVTSDTTFQITDSLVSGYNYWQIGVMDNYGNWAKSAEGVFEVQ